MREILETLSLSYFDNPLWRYLLAAFTVFAAFLVLSVLRAAVSRRARGRLGLESLGRVSTLALAAVSLYAGFAVLRLHPKAEAAGGVIFVTILAIQALLIGGDSVSMLLAQTLLRNSLQGSAKNPAAHDAESSVRNASLQNAARNLGVILKVAMWTLGVLFILSNMGLNIGSLIAGLGIGGIAIALATQSVLGDAFGCFVIYFDRPFEVGEAIQFGDITGTVEQIGLRTTRLRTERGDLAIVGNAELTRAHIRKPADFTSRRVAFSLGLTYATPVAKLRHVPEMLRAIVESVPRTRFDRAHLLEMGAYSLNFQVVFFIEGSDYASYAQRLHGIHLAILEMFAAQGIHLAFPTQTLQIERQTDNA